MKVIKPNTLPTTLAGFSRASTATYIDDGGGLQTAGVNVPRWERARMLVEASQINYAKASEALGSASWVKLNAVVTDNVFQGPFPSSVMAKAVVSAVAGRHEVRGGFGNGAALPNSLAAGTWSISVFAAEAELRYLSLLYTTGGSVGVDLGTGEIVSESSAVGRIVPVRDGYRVSMTFTATGADGALYLCLRNTPGHGVETWLGDGVAGLYLGGVQCEPGDGVSSYIPTPTTNTVTRSADVLTGSGLLYTTATDATPVYAAGTTYADDALVQFDRSRYQSLQAANTGHAPDVSPSWWARLGPVNQWAMFDDQVSTQTSGTAPLRVSFDIGLCDSLAVLAVDASTVTLVVTDGPGGAELYRRTIGLGADVVTNWYEYFYADLDFRRQQALFTGLPLLGSAVAHLTVAGSGTVRLGHVSWGRMKPVGEVRYGVRAGIKDFSRKDTDDFGVTTFVRRANSKTLTAQLEVQKAELNRTQNLLTALSATPVVWVGSDDPSYSDLMVVFGFYRDFYGSVDYPTKAIYSLEIEGLT